MDTARQRMTDAAVLYYEKHLTMSEIARRMCLSRQTVSKLIAEAEAVGIVEIRVRDPENDRRLAERITEKFGVRAVVCPSSAKDASFCRTLTVRAAAEYLAPKFAEGGKKIAISWGRTVEEWIDEFPHVPTEGNLVFPLFGATDTSASFFSPNELARKLADKLTATVKNTWFPYRAEGEAEAALFRATSCYRTAEELWHGADLAVVGIGDRAVLDLFRGIFGIPQHPGVAGDIATHFFDADGKLVPLVPDTLCASAEDLRRTGEVVAVASGVRKAAAIRGALMTGLVDTLVTDEYTAAALISLTVS